MTKRLVDIDDDVLGEARRALGTASLKDTVNTALAESVASARRRSTRSSDLVEIGELLVDLIDPEVMAKAWE